jgi:hypothetical protein
MSNSSAPPLYSITSSDTVTLTSTACDTITLTGYDPASCHQITTLSTNNTGTYTYSPSSWQGSIAPLTASQISTVSINTGSNYSNGTINIGNLFSRNEWVDCFPDWDRIQKMCDEYPGLKIAFDQFKTVYKLVRDDYDTPEDQRPKP